MASCCLGQPNSSEILIKEMLGVLPVKKVIAEATIARRQGPVVIAVRRLAVLQ